MKRGISALISAVLLIVFVVTMFIVIFNLTRETVESGFEKGQSIFEGFSNCDEVKFFVEGAECNSEILKVKIKNEKNVDFRDGFVLRFFSSDAEGEIGSFLYNTRLDAYEVGEIFAIRDGKVTGQNIAGQDVIEYNSIESLEIIPKVKAGDGFQFCNDKKVKIE